MERHHHYALLVFSCFFGLISCQQVQVQSTSTRELHCYACGLPKVTPEDDIPGSYGRKLYNNSCDDMHKAMKKGKVPDAFIRTCPIGVQSCFGAFGNYDHEDNDPSNDLKVSFLGCSEAKHKHNYGCNSEMQGIDIKNKAGQRELVEIEVTLCFCSAETCNDPNGDLLSTSGSADTRGTSTSTLAVLLFGLISSRVLIHGGLL